MKKWSALFFLLIALAGSFVPCCGVDDCCADRLTASSGRNDHKSEGTCSPFFACATCPGFVQSAKAIQLAEAAITKPKHREKRLSFHLSSYPSSFWQPPRLG